MAFVFPYQVFVFSITWLMRIGQREFEQLGRVNFRDVFSAPYWQKYGYKIWLYAKGDNFTWIYLLTTFPGIILAFYRRKGLLDR